ncbi:MAG: ankyrin repeat domain-containing protein [Sphingobacteriia bacterium]|nr:ankyrin repeat domain-containing protein [Sphingobacteriia bacterium]
MSKEQLTQININHIPDEILLMFFEYLSEKDIRPFSLTTKHYNNLVSSVIEQTKKNILAGKKFKGTPVEVFTLTKLYVEALESRDIETLLKLPIHIKTIQFLRKSYTYHPFTNLIISSYFNHIKGLQESLNFKCYAQYTENHPWFPNDEFAFEAQELMVPRMVSLTFEKPSNEIFTNEELKILRLYDGVSDVTPFATIANQIQLRDILEAKTVTEEDIQKLHVLIKDKKTLFTDENIEISVEEINDILTDYMELNIQYAADFEHYESKSNKDDDIFITNLTDLLDKGANPNYNHDNSNPLEDLLRKGASLEVIKFLLDKTSNPKIYSVCFIDEYAYYYQNIFHMLVEAETDLYSDYTSLIKMFVEHGIDIDTPNFYLKDEQYPITPLQNAINIKKINLAYALIKNGANLNSIFYADFYRVKNYEMTILDMILSIDDQKKITPLLQALTLRKFDFNIKDSKGRTFIHKFFESFLDPDFNNIYSFETLELFIKSGGDVNSQDNEGNTALHYLIKKEKPSLFAIQTLLQNGIDTSIKNNEGKTVFDIADKEVTIEFNNILDVCLQAAMAESIIHSHSQRITQISGNYLLPSSVMNNIQSSSKSQNSEIYKINQHGLTLLHFAVINNDLKEVQRLLSLGAFIDYKDNFGNTPLHYALGAKAPFDYQFNKPNISIISELCRFRHNLYSNSGNHLFLVDINESIKSITNNSEQSLTDLATPEYVYDFSDLLKLVSNAVELYKKAVVLENELKRIQLELQQLTIRATPPIQFIKPVKWNEKRNRYDDEDDNDNDRSPKRAKIEQEQNNYNYRG